MAIVSRLKYALICEFLKEAECFILYMYIAGKIENLTKHFASSRSRMIVIHNFRINHVPVNHIVIHEWQ